MTKLSITSIIIAIFPKYILKNHGKESKNQFFSLKKVNFLKS